VGHDLGPVLVTGASGYLGQRVLARMHAGRWDCVPVSRDGRVGQPCDLTDAGAVRTLLARTRPSVVIHCAAIVPKSQTDYHDTAAAGRSVTMCQTLAQHADCRLVLASSMTVYPAGGDGPVAESAARLPAPGYARGKWEAEQAVFDRRRAGDVAVRLPGLFGLPRRSGVLFNAAMAFLARRPFAVVTTGEPWAAMTVDDAAECLVRAATQSTTEPSEPVNAGYAGAFRVTTAVSQIASLCGVEWEPPPVHVTPFALDVRRFETRYGVLAATFPQRLAELVTAVRHLALEAPTR
jgi:nucleoside-diphosphate-sugar epimerase